MRTEVIVDPGDHPRLTVRIRCLQVQHRDIEVDDRRRRVVLRASTSLELDGTTIVPWDEAVEHEIDVDAWRSLRVADASTRALVRPARRTTDVEVLRDHRGDIVGRAVRRREQCRRGRSHLDAARRCRRRRRAAEGLRSPSRTRPTGTSLVPIADAAMRRSLVAVHTLLAVDDASFVSLLEPAPSAEQAVAGCTSDGTFPVLIGEREQRAM